MTHSDPTPANPAQGVTTDEILAWLETWRLDAFDHGDHKTQRITEALTAAIGAGGQAVAAYIQREVLDVLSKDKTATGTVCSGLLKTPFGNPVPLYTHPAPSGQAVATKEAFYAGFSAGEANGKFDDDNVDDAWARCSALAHPSPAIPVKEVERVLEPFADVAEEYAPQEADNFEVWKDAGPDPVIRASFRLEHYRAARALLSRLRAGPQEGWRPMDSAPKDGTFVDLWARLGAYCCDKWERYPDMWWAAGINVWRNGKGDIRIKPEHVTHWMPLPAAPSPAKGGGR